MEVPNATIVELLQCSKQRDDLAMCFKRDGIAKGHEKRGIASGSDSHLRGGLILSGFDPSKKLAQKPSAAVGPQVLDTAAALLLSPVAQKHMFLGKIAP